MELFRIVGCLHLSNRCPRDADFYIIGDFQMTVSPSMPLMVP